MSRCALALVACALALTPSLATSAGRPSDRPVPRLAHPITTAKPLVNRFFRLTEHKDRAALNEFLAAGYQVQRADGSGGRKAPFLAKLPTIKKFSLSRFSVTQVNGALVVRYLATVTGVLNGKLYTPGPAPRLSVFTWNGDRWQLAAHANFNPLKG